jgi:hypothetical protein
VTTLPETHIALIGMEKVVSSLAEALDIITIRRRTPPARKLPTSLYQPLPDELAVVLLTMAEELARDRGLRSAHLRQCGAAPCLPDLRDWRSRFGHIMWEASVGAHPFFHGNEKAREILGPASVADAATISARPRLISKD